MVLSSIFVVVHNIYFTNNWFKKTSGGCMLFMPFSLCMGIYKNILVIVYLYVIKLNYNQIPIENMGSHEGEAELFYAKSCTKKIRL